MWTNMAEVLTPTSKGSTSVEHFTVTAEEAKWSRIRALATRGREPPVQAGMYVRLMIDGKLVMSDTQMERDTNREFVLRAQGDVLLADLGLGMVLLPLLAKESVKSVLVVEKSQEVIDLILPQIEAKTESGSKLQVTLGDIFTWKPPRTRWDTIYFDIWGDVNSDDLREMNRLHNRFRSKLRPKGWMSSWMFQDLQKGWTR